MATDPRIDELRKRLYKIQQAVTPTVVPFGYLIGLVLGLTEEEAPKAILYIALPVAVVAGLFGSNMLLPKELERAVARIPGEPPGARLQRILELPRRVEHKTLIISLALVSLFAAICCWYFDKSQWRIVSAFFVTLFYRLFVSIPQHVASERVLRELALEEFRLAPGVKPRGSAYLWPRQSWYLPYAFGVVLVCGVGTVLTLLATKAIAAHDALLASLAKQGQSAVVAEIVGSVAAFRSGLVLPLFAMGLFFVLTAGLIAWMLATRQHEGAKALEQSIQVIAGGSSTLPEWIATDELGDLAFGLGAVYQKLEGVAANLQSSARRLSESGEALFQSGQRQSETVTRQASALQEASVSATEIMQTSQVAARRSEEVLALAEQADLARRTGAQAIDETVGGLEDIQREVSEVAERVRQLGAGARQVAGITETVKDLADQSNMLALNAAIEATRSGEHGKGFAVVAREMRTLADQSLEATRRVGRILDDIAQAINATVSLSEKGQKRVEAGLVQVRTSGERLRQLADIVSQNVEAVRQISSSVTRQNVGVTQLVATVAELSRMMDEAVETLRTTEAAAELVREVGDEVSAAMGLYAAQRTDSKAA